MEEKTAPGDTLSLRFTRTGAAFADDPILQTNLCLASVAMALIDDPSKREGSIREANGNTVGTWEIR